jgi:Holliday junction resolvase-like predicted endonuclease
LSTCLQPKELLLDVCPPGNYSGREAHLMLNKLAEKTHVAILEACGEYDKQQLVMIFYDLYDRACYKWMQRQHMATGDLLLIKKVKKAPSIFKYLLECAILSEGREETRQMDRKDLLSLILATEIFFQICDYSNFLYQNDFRGGFKITGKGEISFTFDEKVLKSQEGYIGKLTLIEKKATLENTTIAEANFKDISLKNDAVIFDPLFYETYGIKLSVIVDIAETIVLRICRKPFGVEAFHQNLLVKKIRKITGYSRAIINKALEFLKIDKTLLLNGWVYFKQRDMPISVSRRPIVRPVGGPRNKGDVLYLGSSAVVRSIVFLITDIDRGVIKLGNIAEEWAQEKGSIFENQVRRLLSESGFKVIRVTDPPANVGEIDAVALIEMEKTLLIIEAKAPKLDLVMNRAKWHFERSRKWCKQLQVKTDWASKNIRLLTSRVGASGAKVERVLGIIVTRVPWYVDPDLPYKVFSYEEFENFVKAKKPNR